MRAARPARAGGGRPRERHPLPALRPPGDDGQARLTLQVYLARHGETEWSASGRHTGKTDLPLTAAGEAKAIGLGARLAYLRFDTVYSSPLLRARQTAELAGFAHPTLSPLLREVDYGAYEGLTTAAIHQGAPGWELYTDGCPGGETPAEIYERAGAFIALASRSGGTVLAFAHGHILRAVAAAWIAADITVAAGLMLDVATLSVLTDDGRRAITLWNSPG